MEIQAEEIRAQAKPFDLDQSGPKPIFKETTQTGQIEINFVPKLTKISKDIDIKTLKYEDEAEPGVKKPVIEVYVEPTVEQDEEDVQMTWEYIELT